MTFFCEYESVDWYHVKSQLLTVPLFPTTHPIADEKNLTFVATKDLAGYYYCYGYKNSYNRIYMSVATLKVKSKCPWGD